MNPAEALTLRWLTSKGYFVIPSVKDGRLEADLFAIRLSSDGLTVGERLHVEVTVSAAPFKQHKSEEFYEKDADRWVERKFGRLENTARRILGGDYSRWLVLGRQGGGADEEEVWNRRLREKHNISVIRFDQILREYSVTLTTRPLDDVSLMLHLFSAFGASQAGNAATSGKLISDS